YLTGCSSSMAAAVSFLGQSISSFPSMNGNHRLLSATTTALRWTIPAMIWTPPPAISSVPIT
ncbi:hypothetical protein P4V54_12440, partial [Brevibacillus nitrificans]|uniref:hypothetical protein n=1 Tax=Brevibacillus nitrificans TaxID=651560 RepID=UPI002E1F9595|nr:hypothetical protein [Brevibacillus nitrificans]